MCWTNVLNNQGLLTVSVQPIRWKITRSYLQSCSSWRQHSRKGERPSVRRMSRGSAEYQRKQGPRAGAVQRNRPQGTAPAVASNQMFRLINMQSCSYCTTICNEVWFSLFWGFLFWTFFFLFSILFAIFLGNCVFKNFQCVYLVMWRRFFVHGPLWMKSKLGISQSVDNIETGLMSKKRSTCFLC